MFLCGNEIKAKKYEHTTFTKPRQFSTRRILL